MFVLRCSKESHNKLMSYKGQLWSDWFKLHLEQGNNIHIPALFVKESLDKAAVMILDSRLFKTNEWILKQKASIHCSFQDLEAVLFFLVKYFYKYLLAVNQPLTGSNIRLKHLGVAFSQLKISWSSAIKNVLWCPTEDTHVSSDLDLAFSRDVYALNSPFCCGDGDGMYISYHWLRSCISFLYTWCCKLVPLFQGLFSWTPYAPSSKQGKYFYIFVLQSTHSGNSELYANYIPHTWAIYLYSFNEQCLRDACNIFFPPYANVKFPFCLLAKGKGWKGRDIPFTTESKGKTFVRKEQA